MSSEILEKVGLKTCSRCGQTLPVSEFGKCKSFKDGLQYNCKSCEKERHSKWRDDNRAHVNEHARQYRNENLEHINEWRREWQRQWRDENREHVNNYHREYCREYNQDSENRRKYQVRQITNAAIARGELIRPDACPQCGANDSVVEAHHLSYDYGEELNVMWLCRKCHKALHRRNKID